MQVLRDFEELLALLNGQKVKYVIVGGYAVARTVKLKATKMSDFSTCLFA